MTAITSFTSSPEPPSGSIRMLAPAYGRALAAQAKSPRTVETYLEAVRRLDTFLQQNNLPRLAALLRRDHLDAFVADVLRTQSPATALARFRALQSFFRWCEETGAVEHTPMAEMRPPTVARPPARPPGATPAIPDDAVDRLLAACAGRDFRDLRDLAIVRLFLDTGLRRNELAMLTTGSVDLGGRTVAVPGKVGAIRTVPFTATTARALERYLRAGRAGHPDAGSAALWLGHGGPMTGNGIYQAIEARATKAGFERISPDQLRQASAERKLGGEARAKAAAPVEAGVPLSRAAAEAGVPAEAEAVPATVEGEPGAAEAPAPPPADLVDVPATAGEPADGPAGTAATPPAAASSSSPAVYALSTRTRGPARRTTLVVVSGLGDVAHAAGFMRCLRRLDGVHAVGVASGRDGALLFTVVHDPGASLGAQIPTIRCYGPQVVGWREGAIDVQARDPGS